MDAPLLDQLTVVIKLGADGDVPEGLNDLGMSYTPEGKISQDSAHYRRAENDQERCGHCAHFASHACELVKGRISPSWLCDLYEAR